MHLTVHFYKEKANIENSTIKYIPESGGTPRSFWISDCRPWSWLVAPVKFWSNQKVQGNSFDGKWKPGLAGQDGLGRNDAADWKGKQSLMALVEGLHEQPSHENNGNYLLCQILVAMIYSLFTPALSHLLSGQAQKLSRALLWASCFPPCRILPSCIPRPAVKRVEEELCTICVDHAFRNFTTVLWYLLFGGADLWQTFSC
jgi:hypothetical protein